MNFFTIFGAKMPNILRLKV